MNGIVLLYLFPFGSSVSQSIQHTLERRLSDFYMFHSTSLSHIPSPQMINDKMTNKLGGKKNEIKFLLRSFRYRWPQ